MSASSSARVTVHLLVQLGSSRSVAQSDAAAVGLALRELPSYLRQAVLVASVRPDDGVEPLGRLGEVVVAVGAHEREHLAVLHEPAVPLVERDAQVFAVDGGLVG